MPSPPGWLPPSRLQEPKAGSTSSSSTPAVARRRAFAAAKASDLIVVPVQPSAVDLKSIPATRDLIAMAGALKALAVEIAAEAAGVDIDATEVRHG
jgi:hypothetical protein